MAHITGPPAPNGTFAPWTQQIVPLIAPAVLTVGAWTFNSNSGAFFGGWYSSSGAQNDSAEFDLIIGAGTYRFDEVGISAPTNGIITVQIDDGAGAYTSVGTIDTYSAGTVLTARGTPITGIVLTGAPIMRRVRLLAATKNASATQYFIQVSAFQLTRTA